jgi:hypothetical protein
MEKYLLGKSFQILRDDGISETFDLFIFSCGWESRCKEITNHDKGNFQFNTAVILSFTNAGELGYKAEYMDKLFSFAKSKTENINRIEHESTDSNAISNELDQIISKLTNTLGRPLHIGFDITCCPRFLFLRLLSYCIRNYVTNELTFFYSEGIYRTDSKEYIHTKGSWKIREISGFEARDLKLNKRLFIVSAGWEGNRYRSLVAKYEPDHLGILLPDPGFTSEYAYKSIEECKPLIEDYNLGHDAVVSAQAGDAIAAWEVLKSPSLNMADHHIAYLTFGPKPHALAMGIRGILNDPISVIYRIPEKYIKIEVEPNGISWRYDVKNLLFI